MDETLILQTLAVLAGATGVLSWVYIRYQGIAKKYPLLIDALSDFLAVAKTYYQAKADGSYSTEDQIAMGQATIEFINALEAIGIDTGVSSRIMQITPLIPSDAAIKTIQDQIDKTIATGDPGSTERGIVPNTIVTREG